MRLIITFLFIIKITVCEIDKRILTTLKYSKYYVHPVIVNGSPAKIEQVPYLVSIKEQNTGIADYWSNLCGANIITEYKLLTAAHCFDANEFYYVQNPQKLRVFANVLDTFVNHSGNTETNEHRQVRSIKNILYHSAYNFPNNDIAVVNLTQKLSFNPKVQPTAYAATDIDYSTPCYSAGYGKTSYASKTYSRVLMIAHINTISKKKCSNIWGMLMDTFVCSNTRLGDVSVGDSGGPLSCINTMDAREQKDNSLLVGIVSAKNFDKTTLFTRVSKYSDWIDNIDSVEANSKSTCFLLPVNIHLCILLFIINPFLVDL